MRVNKPGRPTKINLMIKKSFLMPFWFLFPPLSKNRLFSQIKFTVSKHESELFSRNPRLEIAYPMTIFILVPSNIYRFKKRVKEIESFLLKKVARHYNSRGIINAEEKLSIIFKHSEDLKFFQVKIVTRQY